MLLASSLQYIWMPLTLVVPIEYFIMRKGKMASTPALQAVHSIFGWLIGATSVCIEVSVSKYQNAPDESA